MTFSATSIVDLFPFEELPPTVARHADGTAWKTLQGIEVIALAKRGLIVGKGSWSKLRFVVLEIPAGKAEDLIEQDLRALQIRGRLAQSQASQTCIGEKWIGLKGIPAMVYKHVRTSVFAPEQRAQYV